MHVESHKFTEWLAPLPEEEYLRVLYVGKLQLPLKTNEDGRKEATIGVENMINEIWKVASVWNTHMGISGHLAYTLELHVAQLLEGRADAVNNLMAKIKKDPRVNVHKVFRRKLQTMNLGWNLSMCYSFQITTEQYRLIADGDVTLKQMFDGMKNTCEVLREGWNLNKFYKATVDTFLLKYISIEDKVEFKSY
jgi:hypothetical protein